MLYLKALEKVVVRVELGFFSEHRIFEGMALRARGAGDSSMQSLAILFFVAGT